MSTSDEDERRGRSRGLLAGLTAGVGGLFATVIHFGLDVGQFLLFDAGTWFSPVLYFGRFVAPTVEWITASQSQMLITAAVVVFGVGQFALWARRNWGASDE